MIKYKCWREYPATDDQLDFPDWVTVNRCFHPEDAATDYAEKIHVDSAGEYGLEFDVWVQPENGGTITRVKIEGEYDINWMGDEQDNVQG